MHLLISEVLDEFEKAKSKQDKIAVLKKYESPVLRGIMRINFDPNVSFDLPEGEPPYRKDTDRPIDYQQTTLTLEYRRFYIWHDPNVKIPKLKKESLFIEMLEGLHVSEAEVIILAKDKNLSKKYKSLKEDIVREAFPVTLPPKVDKPKTESPLV